VGIHADPMADSDGPACEAEDARTAEGSELEVRWMATGAVVCSVAVAPSMCIFQVKHLVHEQTGIPVEDQRLLLGSRELSGDAVLPRLVSAPLLLVRSVSDPLVTNLGHFRAPADFEALPSGAFTQVRRLATGSNGDVFQYRWRGEDSEELVAVKRLRSERLQAVQGTETDERVVHMEPWKKAPEAEDALTEIGVLSYLARQPDMSPHILRMRGVFAEEGFAWLVTEFADGGDLFDVAAAGRVPEDRLRRYMFQLFQAVEYLHRHRIGHRDISLENVLLKEGSVRLMDFGMSVSSHSASGVLLRFFRAVGKDSYRAPEVYCPSTAKTRITVPAGCKPGSVAMAKAGGGYLCEVRVPADAAPGQSCMAEVWGYAAPLADVFSCGVCLFMLAWQCPPWRHARLADPMFAFVHSRGAGGLEALLRHWDKPLLSGDAMAFLAEVLQPDPTKRPSAEACLVGSWLAPLAEDG